MPTGRYLETVYMKRSAQTKPHIEREIKKLPCDQLNVDGSHKVSKRLCWHNGNPIYSSLQTGLTQNRQIRLQHFAVSESHEQMRPALEAMKQTQAQYGQSGPKIVMTDNPTKDRDFFMAMFPSVRKTQDHLDKVAVARNAKIAAERGIQVPKAPPIPEPAVLNRVKSQTVTYELDTTVRAAASSPTSTQDSSTKVWIVSTRQATDTACDTIRELTKDNPVYILDLEWDTEKNQEGRTIGNPGKVALLQIGYQLEGGIRVLMVQLRKVWSPNETKKLSGLLSSFLACSGEAFVGCCIGADLTKLGKDFGMEQWAKLIPVVEIGMFARQRDVVQDARVRLEHLVDVVLNEKLDKSDEVRCSK